MEKIIIAGTSRKDGDTEILLINLKRKANRDLIDLNNYNFSYYDYEK